MQPADRQLKVNRITTALNVMKVNFTFAEKQSNSWFEKLGCKIDYVAISKKKKPITTSGRFYPFIEVDNFL